MGLGSRRTGNCKGVNLEGFGWLLRDAWGSNPLCQVLPDASGWYRGKEHDPTFPAESEASCAASHGPRTRACQGPPFAPRPGESQVSSLSLQRRRMSWANVTPHLHNPWAFRHTSRHSSPVYAKRSRFQIKVGWTSCGEKRRRPRELPSDPAGWHHADPDAQFRRQETLA